MYFLPCTYVEFAEGIPPGILPDTLPGCFLWGFFRNFSRDISIVLFQIFFPGVSPGIPPKTFLTDSIQFNSIQINSEIFPGSFSDIIVGISSMDPSFITPYIWKFSQVFN